MMESTVPRRSCQLYSHTCFCRPGQLTPAQVRGPLATPRRLKLRTTFHFTYCRRRGRITAATAATASSSRVTVFPAGKKQAKVALPACILVVRAGDVVSRREELTQSIGEAISAGATGILLEDDEGTGGAELYEAALLLKEVLRGRAVLLIQDRTDIAGAAEADGVVLSSRGVPTVVARRSLPDGANLVGRQVATGQEALQAAADGASLVMIESTSGRCVVEVAVISEAKTQQGGSVPVIAALSSQDLLSEADASALVDAGADGVAVYHDRLNQTAASFSGRTGSEASHPVRVILSRFPGGALAGVQPSDLSTAEETGPDTLLREGLRHVMDQSKESLLERERQFITMAIEVLEEVVPGMEEVGLLRDALKQLDQPFLMVVVGEFNSGKSTVINALLGRRFLAEGILPTTNEISILKFREGEGQEEQRMEDGYMVRYLPAALLRDLNIVDTPGTNVILERQQRLTEEYVPRADMVLFTMSADRPFTDSEVRFLKYIRQWGKKVVFLVNKVDILSGSNEVDEVAQFVADNARRVLGVDTAKVLPVSARAALQAKLDATHSSNGFFGGDSPVQTLDEEELVRSGRWGASRFGDLERFMVDFLVGGAAAGESMRLKLQTPLFVADALLDAARQQLASELATAEQEAEAVRSVGAQLRAFRREMEADGAAQRAECRRLVATAVRRAQELVDSVLQLSNREALSAYVFGGGGGSASGKLPIMRSFEAEVVGETAASLRTIVSEHRGWVASNCQRQTDSYRSFAEERAQQLGTSLAELMGKQEGAAQHASSEEARRQWREEREAEAAEEGKSESATGDGAEASGEDTAVAALVRFEPKAAALVLEEEIREAVISSISSAVGAGLVGVVLTWVLPTTLEDALAIVLAGLAGYVALLNLPLRRAEAKAKVERVANNFIQDVEDKLKAELEGRLEACVAEVNGFVGPLEAATLAVVERLKAGERRRAQLADELELLKQRAANIE